MEGFLWGKCFPEKYREVRWYLAGSIDGFDDWRSGIVREWGSAGRRWYETWKDGSPPDWPLLEDGVLDLRGWSCVGPYYAMPAHGGDVHSGMYVGDGSHCAQHETGGGGGHFDLRDCVDRSCIRDLCLGAIDRADAVFAWISDPACYGTLIELGYARAKGLPIWVAFDSSTLEAGVRGEMWFAEFLSESPLWIPGGFCSAREAFITLAERLRAHQIYLEGAARLVAAAAEASRSLAAPNLSVPVRLDPQRNFSKLQRDEIYRRSNGHCVGCGASLAGGTWHADHLVPHSRGGRTEVANGQALCPGCNGRKHARVLTVDEG